MLALPPSKHAQTCVRLQNFLLHQLLPHCTLAGQVASAEVLFRLAVSLGDVDAGRMLVEVAVLGPFPEGSDVLEKKRELLQVRRRESSHAELLA